MNEWAEVQYRFRGKRLFKWRFVSKPIVRLLIWLSYEMKIIKAEIADEY